MALGFGVISDLRLPTLQAMGAQFTGEEAESGRCLLAASRVTELVVELSRAHSRLRAEK